VVLEASVQPVLHDSKKLNKNFNIFSIYKMSLELIIGPMFSGKSSYLLSTIRKYKEINWPVYIITSSFDKRYTNDSKIVNHNQESCKANIAVKDLHDISNNPLYLQAKVIVIEEGQFFENLVEFVLEAVEKFGKHVIVAGLDGDASRKPFGELLNLIPYCDTIVKLKALCKKCNDGSEALFTSNKGTIVSTIDVGSSDKYEALCRKHYLESNPTSSTL
jgi:thymidine kinase